MRYRDNAQLDPSQMGGGGGPGRGGKVAIGGGAGLVVLIIAVLLGINPSTLGIELGGQTGPAGSDESAYAHCRNVDDIERDRDCRFVAYTNSIQGYWESAYSDYRETSVTTFTGSISTACGTATSEVGPFYCPADEGVYLDEGFFDAILERQLGAERTDAVEAYVIAHEIGHHMQNLIGTMERANASRDTGPDSPAVRLELQADCFAGVWFAHAAEDPESPIAEVTETDLNEALASAQAIGDDRIQARTQGRVTPESWTHGSAEQRQTWLHRGFSTGDPNQCDTFSARDLG